MSWTRTTRASPSTRRACWAMPAAATVGLGGFGSGGTKVWGLWGPGGSVCVSVSGSVDIVFYGERQGPCAVRVLRALCVCVVCGAGVTCVVRVRCVRGAGVRCVVRVRCARGAGVRCAAAQLWCFYWIINSLAEMLDAGRFTSRCSRGAAREHIWTSRLMRGMLGGFPWKSRFIFDFLLYI